jgi:hypothetical protein
MGFEMSGKDKAFARPTRLLVPTRRARRYTYLDVGRNKPVRALSAGLVFPALRLPEKLPLLLTLLTYIHVGNIRPCCRWTDLFRPTFGAAILAFMPK